MNHASHTAAAKPLVIIPARGGSKGIPGKNIKPLGGKPLLHYTIEAAREALPDAPVVLSTDDGAIAACAAAAGLEVPYRRPAELATDTAGSREVMLHAMDWTTARGVDYDAVVLLQPTSPLRTAADITGCLELYGRHRPDMVVSVTEASCNPYYDCFETGADGTLHISKGPGTYTRRQDAPAAWQYNGAVYVIDPDALRQMPMGAFKRRLPWVMPRARSIDLDTPLDWLVAEQIVNGL